MSVSTNPVVSTSIQTGLGEAAAFLPRPTTCSYSFEDSLAGTAAAILASRVLSPTPDYWIGA